MAFCVMFGNNVAAGDEYCIRCGAQLSKTSRPTSTPSESPENHPDLTSIAPNKSESPRAMSDEALNTGVVKYCLSGHPNPITTKNCSTCGLPAFRETEHPAAKHSGSWVILVLVAIVVIATSGFLYWDHHYGHASPSYRNGYSTGVNDALSAIASAISASTYCNALWTTGASAGYVPYIGSVWISGCEAGMHSIGVR